MPGTPASNELIPIENNTLSTFFPPSLGSSLDPSLCPSLFPALPPCACGACLRYTKGVWSSFSEKLREGSPYTSSTGPRKTKTHSGR